MPFLSEVSVRFGQSTIPLFILSLCHLAGAPLRDGAQGDGWIGGHLDEIKPKTAYLVNRQRVPSAESKISTPISLNFWRKLSAKAQFFRERA